MKKMVSIIFLAILAATISGCSSTNEEGNAVAKKDGFTRWSYIQELPDGRNVICAATVEALSCDWANAK